MDADGRRLPRLRHGAAGGLPLVKTSAGTARRGARARRAAVVARAAAPTWPRMVDHVEVATVDEISLVLRDGRTGACGGARTSPTTKAEVLAALLASGPAQIYDVTVPGQPTTR